jgi:benzoyl-CoA 2,3-dioxygenase component B
LYDLRNLFQINVEEGRHLWAMVYLLHAYFGRDGREEAEGLLARRSGDKDHPRILGAFNEPTPDWLSFFMFTFFTDRDGKFQLTALSESAFDPLSRTTKFMLKEEAHHMYVGTTGIARVLERTCHVMREHGVDAPDQVRALGVIDLPTIQRYVNFHFSVTLDLFGNDLSSNAANFFAAGIKGRFDELSIADDHQLKSAQYPTLSMTDGVLSTCQSPALNSLNERLRDDYIADTVASVARWNRVMDKHGIKFHLAVPHKAFNRQIGAAAGARISPHGVPISEAQWSAGLASWLPTDEDRRFVQSLMGRVVEPGKYANWIAAPDRGINGMATKFQYVRFN